MERVNWWRYVVALSLAVLVAAIPAGADGGAAAPPLSRPPRTYMSVSGSPEPSYNWSGYAASGQTFTKVQGEFTVPKMTCPAPGAAAVFWVGFDGFQNGTVEQDGIGVQCDYSSTPQPQYYAWWEMWPTNYIQQLPLTVKPGNVVKANVTYSAGTYIMTVANISTSRQSTVRATCAPNLTCSRQSAEWIAERPTMGASYAPLADWNKTKLFADTAATAHSGGLRPVSYYANTPLDMIDTNDVSLATVAPLLTGGKSFYDTWHAAQ